MAKTQYISSHKDVLGGAPVITGTRIPVERVSELVRQGYNEKNLKKEFGSSVSVVTLRGVLYELTKLGIEQFSQASEHESHAARA